MAESKMNEVAKLLGIELEEEFKVEGLSFIYKLKKDGLVFWTEEGQEWIGSQLIEDLLAGKLKIVKLPKPILSDSEKSYLSSVIEPFKDRVMYINKAKTSRGAYIAIHLNLYTGGLPDIAMLPEFEEETMYKGMELGREYTLEELGL